MFRRKDENSSDATSSVITPPNVSGSNAGTHSATSNSATSNSSKDSSTSTFSATDSASYQGASGSSASGAATASNPATSSAHTTPGVAQSTSATVRPVADASRVTAGLSSYRPAAVADANRPVLRASEPMRVGETARPETSRGLPPGAATSAGSEKSLSVKTNRRVLTVGNDILLKGEIATCDRLVIEGRVEAKLSEVHTVEIAECGSFKGTAEVEDAEISGVFEGDLVVRNRLVIYATGEVRGNITYGEIEIERGGRLMGEIKTVTSAQGKKAGDVNAQQRNPAKESAAA